VSAKLTRRAALAASTLALLGPGVDAAEGRQPPVGKALVAYFSRSGNTRVIAGQVHRDLKADIFQIEPAQPYPEEYLATVAQATRERDSGFRPPLKAMAPVAGYRTIFLGFPVWGETAPPVIRAFLAAHDLRGKDIRPFITHGGYGLGGSLPVIASHAPGARVREPFVMEADQERRTMNQVNGWLGGLPKA
jgi:flavodoxin